MRQRGLEKHLPAAGGDRFGDRTRGRAWRQLGGHLPTLIAALQVMGIHPSAYWGSLRCR